MNEPSLRILAQMLEQWDAKGVSLRGRIRRREAATQKERLHFVGSHHELGRIEAMLSSVDIYVPSKFSGPAICFEIEPAVERIDGGRYAATNLFSFIDRDRWS
ncbi:MAG: hypothetical protein C0494_15795 [Sphingobium sp.]|nr:hypothetical protein [Sphingobium sp.]